MSASSTPRAARLRAAQVATPLAAVALGTAGWWVGRDVVVELSVTSLVLLLVAVALTELLPIRTPRGRPVPTSTAVIATGALLGVGPPMLALVTALGWSAARLVDRRPGALPDLAIRVAMAWVLAGLSAAGRTLGPVWEGGGQLSLHLAAAAVVVTVLLLVPPVLEVLARGGAARRGARIREEIRATWLADLAIAAVAVLGALVHEDLGVWTLPSVLVPLLAARIGLERFAAITLAYDQTIRAMSRLPEQLGTVPPEHGVRVARLALAAAEELGLDVDARVDLERAAHLHELGHIRLEPSDEPTRTDLARAGAKVVASAGDLDRVAAIIATHGDPEARRDAPPEVAMPARLVAAACEIERYAPDPRDRGQTQEVTVRLVREVDDLAVVQAVLTVLRRGEPLP